jgi:hypothetical protein
VFALCVGCKSDAYAWSALLDELALETGLGDIGAAIRSFDPDVLVVWLQPLGKTRLPVRQTHGSPAPDLFCAPSEPRK